MKTVREVSILTGVSVRTLHHYDDIGLLHPSRVTEAGYRLYDTDALEQLYLILVYRELGIPLKQIRDILEAPDFDRNRVLSHQIELMQQQKEKLENRIALASYLKLTGVKYMDFEGFDQKKIDEYSTQAKTLWGKTDAYREYEKKAKGRSRETDKALGQDMMALFARVGALRDHAPDSESVQNWVQELQAFITEHYYTCTKPILRNLGQMYAGGGSMTENIDAAGGEGTGEFACKAIEIYCSR